ncbi:MFS transporter [Streptomyces amakusaensis]|uniref:MFS transporter n=1 Tax=Streptomyces amakusaensis TaxID=67271 RepID=A0ABW0ACA2_9ACTN
MTANTARTAVPSPAAEDGKLPLGALTALTTAAFLTVLTEALPAGLLPGMSAGLGVGESAAGQAVTVYAIGSAAAAIPLSVATARLPRKRLLLTGMAGFAVANTVTAFSAHYPLTMAARFLAGVAAGLVWALLAGYARRIAPVPLRGRAVAVVMAGIPAALSLGVPAGTFLGERAGWRAAFWAVTVLAVILIGWIAALVPDRPGQASGDRIPVRSALAVPGVVPVLFITLATVLAHTVLYTYIAAFLARLGMGDSIDLVLLAFGLASLTAIWIVGVHINRRLRALTLAAVALFATATTVLAVTSGTPALVYPAVILWGLGFGGIPALLQTAVAEAAGPAADTAQAMLVTLWNIAMAAGGAIGALLLTAAGPSSLPWAVLALLIPSLIVVTAARSHGFPARRP